MKRMLYLAGLCLLLALPCGASQYNTGVTIPIAWMIQDGTGHAFTTGTPRLGVMRVSDGKWFDWVNVTWSTVRDATCMVYMATTERSLGLYTYTVSAASVEFRDDAYVAFATDTTADLSTGFDFLVTSTIVDATVVLGDGTTRVYTDGSHTTNRIVTGTGSGIDMVFVRAYTTADWNANLRTSSYVRAVDYTDTNGDWELYLTAGVSYTILFTKQGVLQPTTLVLTP